MISNYATFALLFAVFLVSPALGSSRLTKRALNTPNAPSAIGPYSQAILITDGDSLGYGTCMVYVAGQIGLTPGEGGELVEGGIVEGEFRLSKDALFYSPICNQIRGLFVPPSLEGFP